MKRLVYSALWTVLLIFAGSSICLPFTLPSKAVSNNQPSADRGNFDGPAELPRVYVKTAVADSPAPGKVRILNSDANLQSALDEASCGDTLELQAGATYTGDFALPKKPCDDQHWIIVRTGAPDQALPAEGTRLTPCYAGVASLPGRPDFHCASTNNVMPRISYGRQHGSGPLSFADGANHYRFIGVEITRDAPGADIGSLVGPQEKASSNHIIFDRCWIHGTEHDETQRGLFLRGTTYIGVVDSFFSDLHCVNSCTDAQTVGGGGGDIPNGFYKIVNDFLEASGENVLFGGGEATVTPTDIEIRHNFFFKPMIWKRGEPGFTGSANGKPFIVKNHLELKNAQRVLIEGNIMENNWGGFTQSGVSMLLTPKNQNGHCPTCRVTDVTIRNCSVSHVAGAFGIGNGRSDSGDLSSGGERYSIHDVVVDDIDGEKYNGHGAFMILISNLPVMRDFKMDHVTALSARVLLAMGVMNGKIQNLTFTNNLVGLREKQITTSGGGAQNCVFQPERQGPEGVLTHCVEGLNFTRNAIIGAYGSWPPGNFFPKDVKAVGLVDDRDGIGRFQLCHGNEHGCKGASKYASAGTDGKDIGADIPQVRAAIKGVI